MATKYWARLIPEDVAKRAQVVFASDYDALAAELAVREQDHELAELQAKSAEQGWNKVRELEAQLERCRAANVYDGNAHRRVSELEAELAEAKTLMRTLCNASDAERESAKFGCRMWLGPELAKDTNTAIGIRVDSDGKEHLIYPDDVADSKNE